MRMSAFWQLSGTLHEILEFDRKYGKEWGGLSAYRECFALLEVRPEQKREAKILDAIRNRAAFHFDPTLPRRVLPQHELTSQVFMEGDGRLRFSASHGLSEAVALSALLGHGGNIDASVSEFATFSTWMIELCVKFCRKADNVTMARLIARGFRFERAADLFAPTPG